MAIERGESVVSTPVKRTVTLAEIRKAFKIGDDAEVTVVGATAVMPLAKDDVIVAEWTETKVTKARAKKEKAT